MGSYNVSICTDPYSYLLLMNQQISPVSIPCHVVEPSRICTLHGQRHSYQEYVDGNIAPLLRD